MDIKLTLEKALGILFTPRVQPRELSMQIPDHAKSAVREILKSEQNTGLLLYKESDDGPLRWVAVYSNNFRDDDFPVREIISAQSHRNFAKLVEEELAEPPDYWIWHEPSLKIGTGEWVAVDEHDIDGNDIVFALAGGTIDEGREELAKALDVVPEKALSHGMPIWSVMYSDIDPDLILGHITTEVSWLPVAVAANKLTAGMTNVFKERPDMVNEDKLKELVDFGVPQGLIDELVKQNRSTAEKAVEDGLQHKEVETDVEEEVEVDEDTPEVPDAVQADAQTEETIDETDEVDSQEGKSEAPKEAEVRVSVKELSEVFGEVANGLKQTQSAIKELSDRVVQLEEDKAKEQADNTPVLSLAHLMKSANKSVIGSDETSIDGRSSLARKGPAEPDIQTTDKPFFLNWLNGGEAQG